MTTTAPTLPAQAHTRTHEERLDRLAAVAVKAGLNIAHGQELLITAPLEALPLVRRVTEHAYKAGASLVTTFLIDEESTLARYRFAPDDAFDRANVWLQDGIANAYRSGAARLGITGGNPAMLAQQDPSKVGARESGRSPRPAARHSTSSPGTRSTGASSRRPRRPGLRSRFPTKRRRTPGQSSGTRSSLLRASTRTRSGRRMEGAQQASAAAGRAAEREALRCAALHERISERRH